MTAMLQGSLFGTEEAIGLRSLAATRRVELGSGAWIDVLPGWLSGADAVFDCLAREVAWHAEQRVMYERVVSVPRLLSFYGEHDALPHPSLSEASATLSAHYMDELGEPFRTVGLCYYRDGADSVAWHGDTVGRGAKEDTMVAILSVGAPRTLLLRPRDRQAGTLIRQSLGHGDLLIMGGSCQRTWEHAIPKTNRTVGPRISIQFRPHNVR